MHLSSQADRDGNAWIIGKSGYAPEAGWPSFVNLGAAKENDIIVYGFVSYLRTLVCIPIDFYSPIAPATHFYLLGEKATA